MGDGRWSVLTCSARVTRPQAGRHRDRAAIGALEDRRRARTAARARTTAARALQSAIRARAADERLRFASGTSGAASSPGRGLVQPHAERAEPGMEIGAPKPREIAERPEAPPLEDGEGGLQIRP